MSVSQDRVQCLACKGVWSSFLGSISQHMSVLVGLSTYHTPGPMVLARFQVYFALIRVGMFAFSV